MKFIFTLTILLSSVVTAAQDNDVVVAEVNGVKIMKSTLLSYHEQNLTVVRSDKTITLESSLNDLIDRTIGIQDAKKNKVHERPEIIKKMNDIVYHAYISDELTPKLKKIKTSESEIKSYYNKFPEYRTSQILLRLRAVPSKDEVTQAFDKSMEIYASLQKDPSLFEVLVKQHSQTSTALAGGDVGYQPKVRLSPEYYSAIKGKTKGYITKPFRTQYGIHIVKVTGEKTYKQIDQKLYKKIVYDTKRDEILASYFAEKRKAAKPVINKKELE